MSHLTFYTWHSIPKLEMEIVLLKYFPDFLLKKKNHFPFLPFHRFLSAPYFPQTLLDTGQENLGEGSELFKSRSFIVLRQGVFTGWQIREHAQSIWRSQLP